MYLSRKCGGRGMKSIEREYKNTTIKTAAKLFSYPDPAMAAVRSFEAKAVQSGRYSIIKDAQTYARELGLQLKLDFPDPVCYTTDGHEVRGAKIKNCLSKAHQQELRDKVEGEKWQGKLTKSRWEDDSLKAEECFACLHHWKTAPTHTIVGAHELYQQLLPTRIFYSRNTGTTTRLEMRDVDCAAKDQRACNTSWQVALRLRKLSTWNATITHWKSCSSRYSERSDRH